ncbi:MAG: RNA methyltransferase [Bacteroidaceae bacterium]|nr:RNA methyltransferase [Bacteroidaceae bacterium]
MNDMVITSVQNPRVKTVVALQQKSAERRRTGLFVVEGRREVEHCVEMGLEVMEVFVCEEMGGWSCDDVAANKTEVTSGTQGLRVTEVTRGVYEKMAYRGGTEGVMAVVKSKERRLEELDLSENPLIVVVERVEKPGNLGAILRSADAAGADAVVVCDPLTDLWNPNLIRSSIGAVFTVPCVACGSEECIEFLKAHGIQILTAQLQDSELYYDTDMRRGTAIVMGTEATGLTEVWRQAADAHIRIPMLGRLDSLNVSVSAAILLYEAVRQRGGTLKGKESVQ